MCALAPVVLPVPDGADSETIMERHLRSLPRYLRIAECLQEEIESGALTPGTQLPSERALSETFGVTRMTLRQALDNLVAQGLIRRRHGAGTFVAPPKMTRYAFAPTATSNGNARTAWVDDAAALQTEAILVVHEEYPAGRMIAAALGVAVSSPLHCLIWCHVWDHEPLFLERIEVTAARLGDFSSAGSVPRVQVDSHQVEAVSANVFEAQLLAASAGVPLIQERCLLIDADGVPVARRRRVYRSDRVRLLV